VYSLVAETAIKNNIKNVKVPGVVVKHISQSGDKIVHWALHFFSHELNETLINPDPMILNRRDFIPAVLLPEPSNIPGCEKLS
jgi:hypothetical protein